jgi:hypothetical protein
MRCPRHAIELRSHKTPCCYVTGNKSGSCAIQAAFAHGSGFRTPDEEDGTSPNVANQEDEEGGLR